MCGINGFNFQNREIVKRMNDSLKHRGPDDEGIYSNGSVTLGHRRLSIIDLSEKGKQPMSYIHQGKKTVIVFNGEIYNFTKLKKNLKKKGYSFKSRSDTEIILASYLEWGMKCVNKFNGMWAFCIYDPENEILFLSRDRFGKKPLYYYFDGERFIFSSEIKGILEHKIKKKLNPDGIDLYLSLGFIPAPYSIYKKIKKVEGGQNIEFDLKNYKISKRRYYRLPNRKTGSEKGRIEIESLVKNAIKSRLVSDVPLGAFLSGGVDSSTVVGVMSKFLDLKNIHTFSVGFEGRYDETYYINLVKNRFKTRHHHSYFRENDFEKIIKNVFYYYDEPFCDISMFPAMMLSEITKKYITVSLSGDGGDEVFGGYPRYVIAKKLSMLRKIPRKIRRALLFFTPKTKYLYRIREGLKLSLLPAEEFYSGARKEIYKPEIFRKITKEKMSAALKASEGNLVQAVMRMDLCFYTIPDNFLTKVDRASMAHGLEIRCPFLDYKLVESLLNVPENFKLSFSNAKIILKKIFKDMLPDKIIKREKQGFTPPIEEWISKEKYIKEIMSGLEEFHREKIISDDWYKFFRNGQGKTETKVFKNYLIRLFVFIKWHKFWGEIS